jgi:flagellar protein FliO/FliZ
VIGVIYGLYWVLKQVKAAREETASGEGLTTLATLPLGTNRSIHLVRAGHEIVLVGAGEHGVTPIRTYSEAEARALGLLVDDEPEPVEPARKASWLDELRRRTVIR